MLIAFVGGAVVLLAAAKVVAQVGPNIPGPPIRVVLGLEHRARPGVHRRPQPSPIAGRPRGTPAGGVTARMPYVYDESRAIEIDGRVLLVGGLEADRWGIDFSSVATVDALDLQSGARTPALLLPLAVDHTLPVRSEGDLYVVGGYSKRGRQSRTSGATDPLPRSGPSCPRCACPAARSPAASSTDGSTRSEAGDHRPEREADRPPEYPARVRHPRDLRHRLRPLDRRAADADSEAPRLRRRAQREALRRRGPAALRTRPFARSSATTRRRTAGSNCRRCRSEPPRSRSSRSAARSSRPVEATTPSAGSRRRRGRSPLTRAAGAGCRDLEIPRHGHTSIVHGGRLYAIGGSPCAGYGTEPSIESIPLADVERG